MIVDKRWELLVIESASSVRIIVANRHRGDASPVFEIKIRKSYPNPRKRENEKERWKEGKRERQNSLKYPPSRDRCSPKPRSINHERRPRTVFPHVPPCRGPVRRIRASRSTEEVSSLVAVQKPRGEAGRRDIPVHAKKGSTEGGGPSYRRGSRDGTGEREERGGREGEKKERRV